MIKIIFLCCVVVLMASISCTPQKPLTSAECKMLLTRINQIFGETLQGQDRQRYFAESIITEQDINECVTGDTWTRAGFDCVMKAKKKGDLDKCILYSN